MADAVHPVGPGGRIKRPAIVFDHDVAGGCQQIVARLFARIAR
jgi:hypothetical protein